MDFTQKMFPVISLELESLLAGHGEDEAGAGGRQHEQDEGEHPEAVQLC